MRAPIAFIFLAAVALGGWIPAAEAVPLVVSSQVQRAWADVEIDGANVASDFDDGAEIQHVHFHFEQDGVAHAATC